MKMKILRASAIVFGKLWKAVLAEFLAAMMLIFFRCMSCIPIKEIPTLIFVSEPLGFGSAAMVSLQVNKVLDTSLER